MKFLIYFASIMMILANACTKEQTATPSTNRLDNISITIGDRTFTAALEQNSTAEAFRSQLPLTLDMQELNGNEKYHYLSTQLPTNSTKPDTIHAGDLMLYGNNCLVVFYETFQTNYAYSPIGHIVDAGQLKEALGGGNVKVQFTK